MSLPRSGLLADLDAFFLERGLDGDATDERVWLSWSACGARIERQLTVYDA